MILIPLCFYVWLGIFHFIFCYRFLPFLIKTNSIKMYSKLSKKKKFNSKNQSGENAKLFTKIYMLYENTQSKVELGQIIFYVNVREIKESGTWKENLAYKQIQIKKRRFGCHLFAKRALHKTTHKKWFIYLFLMLFISSI